MPGCGLYLTLTPVYLSPTSMPDGLRFGLCGTPGSKEPGFASRVKTKGSGAYMAPPVSNHMVTYLMPDTPPEGPSCTYAYTVVAWDCFTLFCSMTVPWCAFTRTCLTSHNT